MIIGAFCCSTCECKIAFLPPQVESQKLEWKVTSKVGSMDNAKHKAGGGERKVCKPFFFPFPLPNWVRKDKFHFGL